MATLPNGVVTPTSADMVDPTILLGKVADGFSDALGGLGRGARQPLRFSVADQNEKATLKTSIALQLGDEVFVRDTKWWETYMTTPTGAAWKITKTTEAVPFPAALIGISVGNGSSNLFYTIDGDLVTVRGTFTFGSTSSISTTPSFNLPVKHGNISNASAYAYINIGSILCTKYSTGAMYAGPAHIQVGGVNTGAGNQAFALLVDVGATSGRAMNVTATVPFTWAGGDQLSVDLRYRGI